MKTSKIVSVYKTMNDSKLTKMEDADKFKVIKALRAIKPINEGYEEFVKLTHEKLKDDKMEEMQKKAQHWQEMQSQGKEVEYSFEERKELNEYFQNFNNTIEKLMKEEGDKENELTYDKLSEDAFGKYIASNDFNVSTIMDLQEILVGE